VKPVLPLRFNVPDPYQGQKKPEAPSYAERFRSEGMLLLTEPKQEEKLTGAAAVAAAVAAVPGGRPPPSSSSGLPAPSHPSLLEGPQYPPPPPRPSSHGGLMLPPPPPLPQHPQALTSAKGGGASGLLDPKSMAEDFLSSLQPDLLDSVDVGPQSSADGPDSQGPVAGPLGGADGTTPPTSSDAGEGAPPLPSPPPLAGAPPTTAPIPPNSSSGVRVQRPLDLFKAIFEADEDEDEDEEEAAHPGQPQDGRSTEVTGGSGAGEDGAPQEGDDASPSAAAPPQEEREEPTDRREAAEAPRVAEPSRARDPPGKALAEALLRAQAMSEAKVAGAKAQASHAAAALGQGLPSAVAPVAAQMQPRSDPALQDRILSALATLRGLKKERKEKKRKKDKKGKKDKGNKKGSKGKKDKKRKSSRSARGGSSSSSSGTSGGDTSGGEE